MSSLVRDVNLALRRLFKSPGFAITAVLMLALGIGATTAIFSIVEGVLLRPLPFTDPGRLVSLSDVLEGSGTGDAGGVTAEDIRNYSRDTHSFSAMGGYTGAAYELSGAGVPARVNAARMTAGVFPTLAVAPLLGRVYTQAEDAGDQAEAVLSYATWQSRFGGAASILGTKILLDRKPYQVIGVMPRNFEFPLVPGHLDRSELWIPASFTAADLTGGEQGNWRYDLIGRLKPGSSQQQAAGDAERVAAETSRNYPSFMTGLRIHAAIQPLQESTVAQARPLVRILFLAVAVLLLIACANFAGLLLVRTIRSRRETAVRLALGASVAALLRQTVAESLVLSLSGGLLGLALAGAALRTGVSLLPETLPRLKEITLDWPVVLFAFGLAVATGLLCGLVPAFAAMRTNMNEVLKEGGRTGSAGGANTRLRSGLVITQIAVATGLLAASGLLLRSFEQMRDVDLGFRPDHTLAAAYFLPHQQYATQASIDRFNGELLRRLERLPGVTSAGVTSVLPASGSHGQGSFLAEGSIIPKGRTLDLATTIQVQGDYFKAMAIPLLRGRLFNEEDRAGTQLVVLVNHQLASQTWPGQNPLGKRLKLGTQVMLTPWATVVGEVADAKEASPDTPAKQAYYVPIDQSEAMLGPLASPTDLSGDRGYIALRTAFAPEQMENTLRATVHSIDPQLPLTQVQTMEHAVSGSEAPRRFNTVLISAFAGIAVLLAVLGIYSVTAFSVALRAQEMAIRLALGSQRSGIVRLVLSSAARLAAIGCALGLLATAATSHLLRSFLFGVDALDPLVLGLAVLAMLLVALAASLIPARRAATTDPMAALRAE